MHVYTFLLQHLLLLVLVTLFSWCRKVVLLVCVSFMVLVVVIVYAGVLVVVIVVVGCCLKLAWPAVLHRLVADGFD